MKLKVWLLSSLTPLTVASVLAQTQPTASPAAPPPPALTQPPAVEPEPAAPPTNTAPAKPKHTKSKAKAKHPKSTASSGASNNVVVLNPPMLATVKCDVLDVRGQGSFVGEVITHVKKGETVTVLAEATHAHAKAGEPSKWSRISLPAGTKVWVAAAFVDAEGGTVKAKKINVRGGPGENYSVVARLEKDAPIKVMEKKSSWVAIESPANAEGYVASEYVEKTSEAPATAPASAPPGALAANNNAAPTQTLTLPPVNLKVTPPPTEVSVPAETPQPAPPAPGPSAPAPTPTSQADQERAGLHQATPVEPLNVAAPTAPPPAEPAKEEVPRIVTREGYVHRSYNIQAPVDYELRDIKTGEMTEFIAPAPGQKFKVFVGTRVRITGAETFDPRWPRTPILLVQTVDLMP